MAPMRIAQYSTKHAHHAAVARSIRACPLLELVGVYEPDEDRRATVLQPGPANGGPSPYGGVSWFATKEEMLGDASIEAIACEGDNAESLAQAEEIVAAGKHLWLDKPAGEDWPRWQALCASAEAQGLHIQLGFMLRYNPAFVQVQHWATSGFLGDIFKVRGDMSKPADDFSRFADYPHAGGIFFDLGGHMVDQLLLMYGGRRPTAATGRFFATQTQVPSYADNTVGLLEFAGGGLGIIDISLREHGGHRRFEVFGTKGTAIIAETFMEGNQINLTLDEPRGGWPAGTTVVEVPGLPDGEDTFDLSAAAFATACHTGEPVEVAVAGGQVLPVPPVGYAHELVVQETLLRIVGSGRVDLPGRL